MSYPISDTVNMVEVPSHVAFWFTVFFMVVGMVAGYSFHMSWQYRPRRKAKR